MNSLRKLLRVVAAGLMAATAMTVAVVGQENPSVIADRKGTSSANNDGPANKKGSHTITFHNNGPANITLQRVDYSCMYSTGPETIFLASFTSQSITVDDSNNWGQGCSDESKYIKWLAYTSFDDNGSNGTAQYSVEFNHYRDYDPFPFYRWVTLVSGPRGDADGRGLLTNAACDGYWCLNTAVPGDGDTVSIYFDGSYSGPMPKSVKITLPHDRSAVPLGPYTITGVGTARTQVSVTVGNFNNNPWVDDSGNWSMAYYTIDNPNTLATIRATSPVAGGSSDTATVINIVSVEITGPTQSSVPWTPEVAVVGRGNPTSTVHVGAYQGQNMVAGCTATVAPAGWWSCSVSGLAPGQDYALVAHQWGVAQSSGDSWSWTDPNVAEKQIHVDALPLAITSPADGIHIDGDDPHYRAVAGTGTPNGQVEVWVLPSANRCGASNNSNVANAVISGDGKWSTQATFHFAPGQDYTVQACQTVNGEPAPGATSTFPSWPRLTIANPINGSILPSNTTGIALSGTGKPGAAFTPGTVVPGDGISICSPGTIGPQGRWSCAISGLRAGSYQASMQQSVGDQIDPFVGVRFSVARAVTIDRPQPGQQFPVQTTQIQLQGSGQPGAVLNVNVPDATACPDQSIPSTGQWSCTISGLQTGHSYTATVVQGSSGDIPTTMAWKDPAVPLPFSVEGFAPLTIQSPTKLQWFSSATTKISASGSGQIGAQLNVNVPGATACPDQTIQNGQWSCDISGLMSGREYVLTAQQSMHGVTDKPASVTFDIATAVVVQNPPENAFLPAQTTELMMSGTGQPGAAIAITTNEPPQCSTTVPSDGPSKGQWTCNMQSLSVGTHYTAGVIQSGAGWTDPSVPRHFSVGDANAIAIQSPRNGAMVSSNNPRDGLRVMGAGQSGATAEVAVGNLPPQPLAIESGTWATKPFDISAYGEKGGPLGITATQYLDGVPQGQSQVNIIVAKVATITHPAEKAVVGPATTTVDGTGQDGAIVSVQLNDDSGEHSGCSASVQGGAWSCAMTGLAPRSEYTLVAIQSASNAAWTDAPISRKFYTRDASPLAIVYPENLRGVPQDTPYDVRGTGEPGAEVELKSFNLQSLGTTVVDEYGRWAFPNLLSSGQGCYNLTAEQSWRGYPLTNPSSAAKPVVWYSAGSQSCPGGTQFYITVPMEEQTIIGSTLDMHGYGVPGATVTLQDPQGGGPCITQVANDGQWSCGPYYTTWSGLRQVIAQQTQGAGGMVSGGPLTRNFIAWMPDPIAITSPDDGFTQTWPNGAPTPTFGVAGKATPGATVRVSQTNGSGGPVSVPVAADGTWRTPAAFETPSPINSPGSGCWIYACTSIPGQVIATQFHNGKAIDAAHITVYGYISVFNALDGERTHRSREQPR